MIKICLDAGHYGKYNRSPAVPSYYESDAMWRLHLLLKAELEKYEGVQVITTRKEQSKDLGLIARGQASSGCVLFLSLHSNAVGNNGTNESVDYPVAYCLVNDTRTGADEISKELGAKLAACVCRTMGTTQPGRISQRVYSADRDGDGRANDNYYGVLHGARLANTPGIILEHSFHTNTRSTKWLLQLANLERMAKAEAAVIAEYFGLQLSTAQPEPAAKYYRVQVGAYTVKANADRQLAKIKAAGFSDAFLKLGADNIYRVQVGAFTLRKNAEAHMERVKGKGFSAFITQ